MNESQINFKTWCATMSNSLIMTDSEQSHFGFKLKSIYKSIPFHIQQMIMQILKGYIDAEKIQSEIEGLSVEEGIQYLDYLTHAQRLAFHHPELADKLVTDIKVSMPSSVRTKNAENYLEKLPPLHTCIMNENSQIFKHLLNQTKTNINATTRQGISALYVAAELGRVDMVKMLLNCPTIIANHTTAQGKTPLSVAAMNGHSKIVKLICTAIGFEVLD